MAFGKKARPTVDKDGAALVMRGRDYLADFSGQLGLGIMANLVGQLQYFYTDKVGIAVGSVGIVMAIAKIVDALTDIWFGNIIDHSKGGNMKYYKWMLRMAVPAAAITVLIFTVPIGAGQLPAVLYALVVGMFVFKEFTWKDLPKIFVDAAASSAMCLLIVAAANVFSWLVAYAKIPTIIVNFLVSMTDNKYIIMILLVIFLLIVGMFIETLSATIIVAPILMPVAAQYGIDPVQFALVMVITLVYAGVTPPVGGVLFITMGIAKVKMKETLKYLPPYLGVVCISLLLLIFFPKISLFLPHLLFKG